MPEIKTVDQAGLDFIVKEEGIVLHPYLDVVGVPTIGVGSTYYEGGRRVKMTDPPITKARALSLFRNLLSTYEKGVWSLTRDDITQNQFNALVSLAYNIGVAGFKGSTVLRRVNADPSSPLIGPAFEMWHRAGNKRNVLLGRRQREATLYFKNVRTLSRNGV